MDEIKRLTEKRDGLLAELKRFRDKANDKAQDWTDEDQANYEKLNADLDTVDAELKIAVVRHDQRAAVSARFDEINSRAEAERQERRRIGRDDFRGERRPSARAVASEEIRALALQAWFRNQQRMALTEEHLEACEQAGLDPYAPDLAFRISSRAPRTITEARALSAVDNTLGGYTVPAGMLQPLEVALLAFGGMRQAAQVIRTDSGNDLPYPTSNDTSNTGELLGENTQVAEQNVTFGAVSLSAYKYSSKMIQVPVELLQDTAINLPSFLGDRMGERIGRIQNTHFTTGNNANRPNGLVTAATLGVTAASASAVTVDEIWDLKASVDPAYRAGAGWMLADATVWAIRKLKAGDGHYLWQPALIAGNPNTFDGDPVFINQDVATITNSAKTILYGQFSRYKIRDVQTIRVRRLVERYAEFDQEGFVAFMRSDGDLIDAGTHPVKYLQMHS